MFILLCLQQGKAPQTQHFSAVSGHFILFWLFSHSFINSSWFGIVGSGVGEGDAKDFCADKWYNWMLFTLAADRIGMSDRRRGKAGNDSLQSCEGMMCSRNPSCQNERQISVYRNQNREPEVKKRCLFFLKVAVVFQVESLNRIWKSLSGDFTNRFFR